MLTSFFLYICRDSVPERSIVLMKFRERKQAEEFVEAYNGVQFNSLEVRIIRLHPISVPITYRIPHFYSCSLLLQPEICHVVKVLSVVIDSDDHISQAVSRLSSPQTPLQAQEKGASVAIYELPTCPVCLERMDSTATGLITVPCSHSFHCACLSKWGDSR